MLAFPSLNTSRLRGSEAALSAVVRATPVGMSLFARSLAHEVVEHMEVDQLDDDACALVAEAWARAAASGDRDATIAAVIPWIAQYSGMQPESGLKSLGFAAWDDLIRAALKLEVDVHAEGVDMLADMVSREAEALADSRSMEAIPERAMVEMSYIPGWDGKDADAAVDQVGLRYSSRHTGVGTVECGPQLASMLRFFNVSVPDLLAAVQRLRPDEYDAFADRIVEMPGWQSLSFVDQDRPGLMSAEDVITVIENTCQFSLPNLSFQVRLKSLLAVDPARPIQLDAAGNKYHLGCHDGFVNGAGYMDTFQAERPVSLSLSAGSLIGETRWKSSLTDVYWHVKSAYQVGVSQPSDDQLDISRLVQRMGA